APQLNFICTHNSRRSQFSQLWCKVMSVYFNFPVDTFSGGTAVTACNERTIASLERFGFDIEKSEGENPRYKVLITSYVQLTLFSKLFDDAENPTSNFAAVMTCSDADENCPFIPGCDQRIPLRYEDPKAFDDTALEAQKYDERSAQIAREMKYVFAKLTNNE
ncbi:MAG: low molecular weight phosphatase family protein, partial [Crocinitomicaceae bacterium]